MVIRTFIFFSLFISGATFAQDTYIRPGMLAGSTTIAPSKMLNRGEGNIYFNFFGEYFLDKNLSFRSDSYLFVDSQEDNGVLKDGFRSHFGVAYHFNKGNWDAHIGYQPGFTLMNATDPTTLARLNPSAAFHVGTSYYVWKYFHFFANLSYVRSKLTGYPNGSIQTDELIFAAGLGFQIQTRKKA